MLALEGTPPQPGVPRSGEGWAGGHTLWVGKREAPAGWTWWWGQGPSLGGGCEVGGIVGLGAPRGALAWVTPVHQAAPVPECPGEGFWVLC